VAHPRNPSYSEIRNTVVWSQPGKRVYQTLSLKSPSQKGAWSGSRCRPWVQTPVLQKKKKKKLNQTLARNFLKTKLYFIRCLPIERFRASLSNLVAIGHMWLWNTGNVAEMCSKCKIQRPIVKKRMYLISDFTLITYWNDNILDTFY
jgi:hypothetical protein